MGKSSKKSAPKVDTAPAVVPPSKSAKKGKREAEDELEKQVTAKKRKRDEVAEKQKNEVKVKEKEVKGQKKKEGSSDDSSSNFEEDKKPAAEAVVASKKFPAKNGTLSTQAQKGKPASSSSYSGSSDDECDVDDAPKSNVASAEGKYGPNATKKKAESSSDTENSSLDEDDLKTKVTTLPKKLHAGADEKESAKKVESSEASDSDSDTNSDEDNDQKTLTLSSKKLPASAVALKKKVENGDNSDDETNESPDEDNVKDVEMVDAASMETTGKEAPKMAATSKEQNTTSKTLFVGNLSYDVERADLESFFEDCGEVVDVRLATDWDGRFKGFGHVEFATEEAAQNALKLNGNELLRRPVRLDIARERGAYTPNSRNDLFQKSGSGQSQTVFVKGFDTSLGEDEIKTSLEKHFSSCGMISRISLPKDYDTGVAKGFAYLDFKDGDSFNKALALNGIEVGGYPLSVDEARPRGHNQGRGAGGRHGGGQGGRGRVGGKRWR